MRKLYVCFFMLLSLTGLAQDTIQDPLRNFNGFVENTLAINATRVNTNHTEFNTSDGVYSFKKNNYLPTIEARVNFGWLFQKEEKDDIYSLKTGLNFYNQRANLNDPDGMELQLNTYYISIPIQFGVRDPLPFNTVKNNFFRAFEYSIGGYISSPISQKLDHPDNLDASGERTWFNYLRFGFIGEIAFSSLTEKGKGHRFGLRSTTDFSSITKIRDTNNELYPYYINFGVFYNISNYYDKREKTP